MKKILRFSHKLNAEMTLQALKSQGIEAQIQGSREYATHILGGDFGSFDLIVDEADAEKAEEIIKPMQLENPSAIGPVPAANPRVYFRKAIMFSVLAIIMLPIVLNYSALLNLKLYLKTGEIHFKKIVGTVVILILQVPVIFYIFWILRKFNLI